MWELLCLPRIYPQRLKISNHLNSSPLCQQFLCDFGWLFFSSWGKGRLNIIGCILHARQFTCFIPFNPKKVRKQKHREVQSFIQWIFIDCLLCTKTYPQELGIEQWTKQGPSLQETYILTGPKLFSYKEAELELKLNNAHLGKKHLQIKENWLCRWIRIQRLTCIPPSLTWHSPQPWCNYKGREIRSTYASM